MSRLLLRATLVLTAAVSLATACSTVDSGSQASDNGGAARASRAAEVAESVRENGLPSSEISTPPPVPAEEQAMISAGYTPDQIAFAKDWCAVSSHPADVYLNPTFAPNDAQIREINGWLILCPTHPEAPQLQAAVQRGTEINAQRARGERFYGGTFRVGVEIPPGTYVIEKVSAGCYWERLDATGEIIDNNFIGGETRAQVTIRASDYSFHSEGCGEWVKQ